MLEKTAAMIESEIRPAIAEMIRATGSHDWWVWAPWRMFEILSAMTNLLKRYMMDGTDDAAELQIRSMGRKAYLDSAVLLFEVMWKLEEQLQKTKTVMPARIAEFQRFGHELSDGPMFQKLLTFVGYPPLPARSYVTL